MKKLSLCDLINLKLPKPGSIPLYFSLHFKDTKYKETESFFDGKKGLLKTTQIH